MKRSIKILLGIIAIALIGGWIYWQQNKKALVRNTIEKAVTKGTDSVYAIRYDSSNIDAVNGNATFYNVTLQSDSLQQQLLKFDTASAEAMYNVHIAEVSIRGANIPALISGTRVEAKSIEIVRPVIYVIRSGKKEEKQFTANDTLAIYERLLGKYNNIQADEIKVTNGDLHFADKTGKPHTSLTGIAINLNNFKVDSTKDYNNIISYFIKDVVARVRQVNVKSDNHVITFSDVEYNAPGRFVRLKRFLQVDSLNQPVFDINNTMISNIATDSFILRQVLKADELKTDGGLVKIYRKKSKDVSNDRVELDRNSFDEAILDRIVIGKSKLYIYNRDDPAEAPFILNNVMFTAKDIQRLQSGTNIKNLIGRSKWRLSADGFSFLSENKSYKYDVGAFEVNNENGTMRINHFSVLPMMSEAAFAKSLKYQDDRYDLNFRDISLSGLNINKLINERILEAENVTLQPTLKIFNDRTVTPNPASKVGKYPHQQLQQVKFPFTIRKINIRNGSVYYKERGALSKQTGIVSFENISGVISNVTNVKAAIASNNMLVLNASALFMGVSKLQTTWKLPLNTTNGSFQVSGNAGAFDANALSVMTEPLGMATIKSGKVNKLDFTMTGTDLEAKGVSTLLYEDLKVDILKRDSLELKKKGLMSFVTNFLVKNSNPQGGGAVRKGAINQQREITKSFFNLLWKSIFAAAKKTAQKI